MLLSPPAFVLFLFLVFFLSAFFFWFLVSFSFCPSLYHFSLCPLLLLLRLPSSVSGSTTFSVSSPFFCDSLFCCLWFWRLVAEDCEDDGQRRFSSLCFRPMGWVCVSFAPGFRFCHLQFWDEGTKTMVGLLLVSVSFLCFSLPSVLFFVPSLPLSVSSVLSPAFCWVPPPFLFSLSFPVSVASHFYEKGGELLVTVWERLTIAASTGGEVLSRARSVEKESYW